MVIPRKLAIISILLELAGIILLAFVVSSTIAEQSAAARPAIPQTRVASVNYSKQTVHGIPISISISSLSINTAVEKGYYDQSTGRWSISEDAAYFATMSDEVNNSSGSTFIYGHNSSKIFGKLRQIQPGAIATIMTDNGYQFTYKLTSDENVSPTDTKKLEYSGKPRIVLQTCSGFWNNTRQLSYFELVSYKKI